MAVSLNHLVLPHEPAGSPTPGRKPPWLKMKMPGGEQFSKLLNLVNDKKLHTVCQSAMCT
jgi:lipoic acid synthetase